MPEPSSRLVSLDAFRGATIASMILVNNPGSGEIYAPLKHSVWHGWTFTDLIFPFFLWIAGVAMTFSFARRLEQGAEQGAARGGLLLHALRRSALIFALGLLLNGFPYYNLSTLRIPGVLQRIAICTFFAAVVFLYIGLKGRVAVIVALLAAYTGLMALDGGSYDKGSNFAARIDQMLLAGHMYAASRTWDPEGIVSTLPAIATTLFGILTGMLLRSSRTQSEKTVWLFVAGNALIAAGLVLDPFQPINKSLWTASFSLFMAGMASVGFAFFYWIVDVLGLRRWVRPFVIYGLNAIVVYAASGVLARLMGAIHVGGESLKAVIFRNLFAPLASPLNASLLYALTDVLVLYAVAYVMYRRNWFITL